MADWDVVERDYRAGIMPEDAICKEHGITQTQLSAAARDRMWTRVMLTPEDEATVLAYAEQDVPRFPIDSLLTPEDAKRVALMTAGGVVKLHRTDIATMRTVTSKIMGRLVGYLEETEKDEMQPANPEGEDEQGRPTNKKIVKYLMISGKDSAVELLEKASRITQRVITMEREAYGLESMVIPNDEIENELSKDIRALTLRLTQITTDKAQKVQEVPKPRVALEAKPNDTKDK